MVVEANTVVTSQAADHARTVWPLEQSATNIGMGDHAMLMLGKEWRRSAEMHVDGSVSQAVGDGGAARSMRGLNLWHTKMWRQSRGIRWCDWRRHDS